MNVFPAEHLRNHVDTAKGGRVAMESSLRERFARLGPVQAVCRAQSGSPSVFVLRLARNRGTPRTVDATLSLARRGMPMLRAKRAVEALLASRRIFVRLPTVECREALVTELAAAGISAAAVEKMHTRPEAGS